MEGIIEVAAKVTSTAATEEVPSAPKASDEPAAGGHAVAVLAAALLSVELALAALAALAAAWVGDLTLELLMLGPGHGAWVTEPLYGVDYVHREVVIMYREPTSISRRHREVNGACLLATFVLLCAFPLAYTQYLGASRRVCSAMVGAMALSYLTVELGYVVLGVTLFGSYHVVFGFMWLYAVLCVLCPSGSAVPRQVLRQLLIVSIGTIFVRNVAQSHSVRVPGSRGHCIARKGALTRAPIHRTSSASSTRLSCLTASVSWGASLSTNQATTLRSPSSPARSS
jgi:hypothetical protein